MNFRRVALACLLLLPAAARANPPSDGPYQAVEQQFEAGKYTLAIQLLQAILNQNPGDASAHYWLDRCYYELRDYDNAVAQGEKAVQLAANDSLYHLWLGRSYGGKADRDRSFFLARKTKHEFEEAVRLDPKNIRARRD
ncbi:MAG: tetratricopeptide repeat protein, partial [Steroidobacteraceae bacterium]